MIAKQMTPISGVVNMSCAGRIEIKAMETPASVPSNAARGAILRITGAMNPPAINTKICTNTQVSPASHTFTGSPVFVAMVSMITKVTTNMCGTLAPDGSAHTFFLNVGVASLNATLSQYDALTN